MTSPFARSLLRSAASDRPSHGARGRALLSLGVPPESTLSRGLGSAVLAVAMTLLLWSRLSLPEGPATSAAMVAGCTESIEAPRCPPEGEPKMRVAPAPGGSSSSGGWPGGGG